MNIVILFSGPSSAFENAGYLYPKNLAEVADKPLIQVVISSLEQVISASSHCICIVDKSENIRFHTGQIIKLLIPDVCIVEAPERTSGAACSALLAVEYIDNDEPLVVVNGDQIIRGVDLRAVVQGFERDQLDGGIIVFEDVHPRWSFVKCCSDGLVLEAAEKRPISKSATAGFYYFSHGSDFVRGAMTMIKKGQHHNDLFYLCPIYNELILRQLRIGTFQIPKDSYHTLSSPADVQRYNAILSPIH